MIGLLYNVCVCSNHTWEFGIINYGDLLFSMETLSQLCFHIGDFCFLLFSMITYIKKYISYYLPISLDTGVHCTDKITVSMHFWHMCHLAFLSFLLSLHHRHLYCDAGICAWPCILLFGPGLSVWMPNDSINVWSEWHLHLIKHMELHP